jgi:hypothetical protein
MTYQLGIKGGATAYSAVMLKPLYSSVCSHAVCQLLPVCLRSKKKAVYSPPCTDMTVKYKR